ncbi:molybdenum cofactor guanylyltransferase [Synechococcus sp. MIT S1220]|uniref:molybdenum cofactor guanylyltransferase n=1 Tax=Synechococcus sp. MIT S1220 TaxID=3082549 RepID=UPI0039AF7902
MTLRACILCGGQSRRMGSDKAQLVHPSGGVWLTALVDQLLSLSLPVMVLSGHPAHGRLVAGRLDVSFVRENRPWQGPLQAFARVLAAGPGQPLLVLPVDMPFLNAAVLQRFLDAWATDVSCAAVAHDGTRCQPLLGIYPSGEPYQPALLAQLDRGDRRWQHWLDSVPHRLVSLPAPALLNANCPEDLAELDR